MQYLYRSIYQSILQWDAINGCSIRELQLRYRTFSWCLSQQPWNNMCLFYYAFNRTFSYPPARKLKIITRIFDRKFSLFYEEIMIFVLLQTTVNNTSFISAMSFLEIWIRGGTGMFQTSRNKWRHEAIRRLDCLINQFLLGKYEAKVKLFSSSPFSLLTHFYCSTRMPLLANNFRQEKNLFRRQLMSIYLTA